MSELTPGQRADIRSDLQRYADFLHYVDVAIDQRGQVQFVSRLNGRVCHLYDLLAALRDGGQ